MIERFIAHAPGMSAPRAGRCARTCASPPARWCRTWSRADAPLPRERAKARYSAAEIAAYLALADAQPTRGRRMRAGGLVCLGAGAGLTGADLRGVRGSDIACRSGGVLVQVRGRRARVVPVLSGYHDLLLASAATPEPACSPAAATPGGGT